MMKKLLVLMVMASLLVMGVAVADVDQGGEGPVTADMTFIPDPDPLLFDAVIPGSPNTQVSNLAVGTSHLQVVGISVAPLVGEVFNSDNVEFSLDDATFYKGVDFPYPINILAEGNVDLYVKFTPPVGTSSGIKTGTITYTVNEAVA